ncbi:MAG: DUF1203 domain-containing protein [Gammaproteobacteria bacterium]|nr:DUF1203 domain-containing protein [Gammaproteobacteria bacterium]
MTSAPWVSVSCGDGDSCLRCPSDIGCAKPLLLLAHRPFSAAQFQAELGPIWPCADGCIRHPGTGGVAGLYRNREMLIRGYGYDARIIYGAGKVISMAVIAGGSRSPVRTQRVVFYSSAITDE